MSDSIKVFGNVGSPYTQKILSLLRYRNIPYSVSWGDVLQNLSFLDIEPPNPILLPTMVFKNYDGSNNCKTDTTPIIRYLEEIYKKKSVIPPSPILSFLNYLLEDLLTNGQQNICFTIGGILMKMLKMQKKCLFFNTK